MISMRRMNQSPCLASWVAPASFRRFFAVWFFAAPLLATLSLAPAAVPQPQTRPATTAPASNTLLITGAVSQDLKLTVDDLKKLPRKSVSTKGHDDQMHQYDGVPIGA